MASPDHPQATCEKRLRRNRRRPRHDADVLVQAASARFQDRDRPLPAVREKARTGVLRSCNIPNIDHRNITCPRTGRMRAGARSATAIALRTFHRRRCRSKQGTGRLKRSGQGEAMENYRENDLAEHLRCSWPVFLSQVRAETSQQT